MSEESPSRPDRAEAPAPIRAAPADPVTPSELDPASLRSWRLAVFFTVLPILLLGFSTSAIANRIIFAGWALAIAMLSLSALRKGFDAGRGRATIFARLGLVLAIGMALFAVLVGRHQEIFDLGLRAVAPAGLFPTLSALSTPATWYVVAAILGVGVVIAWIADRSWRP